jgi:hypothetical protein
VNDTVVRLLIVGTVVVLAASIAWVVRRLRMPPHPTVTVGDVGDRPGVVLFTSTTCSTCKEVIARFEVLGIGFREVTSELEPQRFEAWGVTAVPVTVVVDAHDGVVATFSGMPRTGPLRRALRTAGIH